MRSSFILGTVLAAAVAAARCGGNDTPTTLGVTMPATVTVSGVTMPATVTVSIVGTDGNQSYVPNPVQCELASGDLVMFTNNDTVDTHHLVIDDGSADFGSLAPGASSQAKAVTNGNFHCTNHPSMVGSVGGSVAPTPPPGSGDGY